MAGIAEITGHLAPALKSLTVIGVITGVAKAFEWCGAAISPQGQKQLSQWLRNVPGDSQIDAWAEVFPNLIDRVFGTRILSLKFFLRSCVASLIAVGIAALLCGILTHGAIYSQMNPITRAVFYFLILALISNCIPDYLSLLISRQIVRTMKNHTTPLAVLSLLVADLLLTGLIAGVAIILAFNTTFVLTTFNADFVNTIYGGYLAYLFSPRQWQIALQAPGLLVILFCASYCTSIWVWLYVVSSVVVRVLHRVRFIWVKIAPFLDLDRRPMKAIGRVAGVVAGVGYSILLMGLWIYRHL